MVYSLTDKLEFGENPQIELKKGKIVTVNAEAETALKLFDVLQKEGEIEATMKAKDLLFSEKDRKVIESMKFQMSDYMLFMKTAIALCLDEDPDSDEESE